MLNYIFFLYIQGNRSEDTHVDVVSAQSDAQKLYQAGKFL